MPRITEARRVARRNEYLEAAWRCFSRRGVAGTTMAQIAREAGLSAGSTYVHFATKEELVREAVATSLAGVEALVAELGDDDPDPERYVEDLLDAVDRFATRLPGVDLRRLSLQGWAFAQTDTEVARVIDDSYRRIRAWWLPLAQRWVGAAAAPDVVEVLGSLVLGHVAQRALLGDTSARGHAAGLVALARRSREAGE